MKVNLLWKKSDKIALCLSGGVDSVVLFNLLISEYKESYRELVVFHINHGLREESYEEAKFVLNLAAKNNINIKMAELDIKNKIRDTHISEEMFARELRYSEFKKMAIKENVDCILTAHHKNDNIENIVMRLLVGRSIDYNLAIEKKTKIKGMNVYRPLLDVYKRELEEYAKKNNIFYYTDISNFNTDYTRNYVRHNIIPIFEEMTGASIDNLINFATYYKNINNYIKSNSIKMLDELIIEKKDDICTLDYEKLKKLQREEIFLILKEIIVSHFKIIDIKNRTLLDISSKIKNQEGNQSYDLKKNLKIVKDYCNISICKIEKKCYNDKIEINIVNIEECDIYNFNDYLFSISRINDKAEIGFNMEDLPLKITSRQAGDTIKRGNITKKLSRLFIDEKIPKSIRERLPIVRNNKNEIIGILGMGTRVNKKYNYYIKMKG